jgi:hypothetical protein
VSKRFELKPEYVENALVIYKSDLRDFNEKWTALEDLGTDMLVNKDFEDTYKCSMCLNIVKRPTSCKECDALFCSRCIEKNPLDQCSLCNTAGIKKRIGKRLNRQVKNILDDLKFSCPICKKTFKYENFKRHKE